MKNPIMLESLIGQDNLAGKIFRTVPDQPPITNHRYLGTSQPPPPLFILSELVETPWMADLHAGRVVCIKAIDGNAVPIHQNMSGRHQVVEVKRRTKAITDLLNKTRILRLRNSLQPRVANSIGTDPEMFAVDAAGELLPAFKWLKSKAESPNTYWDGYQAEFTTMPATCLAYQVDYIQQGLVWLQRALPTGAKLTLKNTFNIPFEQLAKDDPKYVAFGCNPSLNAYGDETPKVDPISYPIRSAGGHLHLSTSLRDEKLIQVVKNLDRILGVVSVSMFQYYDDPRRRALYGKAGEYRTPTHGLEYRVLSNAWLCHPAITHFVFELARLVMGQRVIPLETWNITEDEARKCINDCDVGLAHQLLHRNMDTLEAMLWALPGIEYSMNNASMDKKQPILDAWKAVIFEGVDKFLKTPDSPSKKWGLKGTPSWINHSEGILANMHHATPHLAAKKTLD